MTGASEVLPPHTQLIKHGLLACHTFSLSTLLSPAPLS